MYIHARTRHRWQAYALALTPSLHTQNRGPEGRFATLQTVAEMDKWTASAHNHPPRTVHWHTLRLT